MKLYQSVLLCCCTLFQVQELTSEVRASACVPVKTEKIKFDKGRTCWIYNGNAGAFEGHFAARQSVGVFMTGFPEVGVRPKKMQKREISVEGPSNFMAFSEKAGFLNFVAPSSGRYRFVVWPCLMQGGYGKVEICAK